jgi:hypothetical protein
VPGSRDPEVRPPAGREKRKRRCQSTGRKTVRVLPRPKGAAKLRGRHPSGAAKPKGASPGGSSEAMAPWWGSRRPSARRQRGWRNRAELHHLHHSTGLRRDNRLLRHHHQGRGQRHHRLRPRPDHRPQRRRQEAQRSGTAPRGPGGPRQGGRSPRPPGADGSGTTSRKWFYQGFSFPFTASGA